MLEFIGQGEVHARKANKYLCLFTGTLFICQQRGGSDGCRGYRKGPLSERGGRVQGSVPYSHTASSSLMMSQRAPPPPPFIESKFISLKFHLISLNSTRHVCVFILTTFYERVGSFLGSEDVSAGPQLRRPV